LFAPAGTPAPIVSVLAKESQVSLRTPEALTQAHNAGFEVVAGTPEQLTARLAAEIPAVKELVARIGIKPE
jgi:tripartite-type tricarboxylate transporter receptor subunit TctC